MCFMFEKPLQHFCNKNSPPISERSNNLHRSTWLLPFSMRPVHHIYSYTPSVLFGPAPGYEGGCRIVGDPRPRDWNTLKHSYHPGTLIMQFKNLVIALRDGVHDKLLIKYSSYFDAAMELLHNGKLAVALISVKKQKKKKKISLKDCGVNVFLTYNTHPDCRLCMWRRAGIGAPLCTGEKNDCC